MNELQALIDAIQKLADMELTDETLTEITHNVDSQFSNEIVMQSVNQIVTNLNDQGLTKKEAKEAVETLCSVLNEMVYEGKEYTGNKKVLVDTIMAKVFNIFYKALDKYHSYAIELPIQLEEGAQIPTYAHESDAAADLYAMENVTLPPHFLGTPIKTGVHLQLPEGWMAMVFPRSSMGAKTSLRLSNSAGIIDQAYTGEVRALYDNIGDEPYEIHKGDRIAQLLVMPSYRFKAKIVESLEETDRGQNGFGSTGV